MKFKLTILLLLIGSLTVAGMVRGDYGLRARKLSKGSTSQFHGDCDAEEGDEYRFTRESNDRSHDIEVECPHGGNDKILTTYIAGLSPNDKCHRDKIEKCKERKRTINGNEEKYRVVCEAKIAATSSNCTSSTVDARIHALCC